MSQSNNDGDGPTEKPYYHEANLAFVKALAQAHNFEEDDRSLSDREDEEIPALSYNVNIMITYENMSPSMLEYEQTFMRMGIHHHFDYRNLWLSKRALLPLIKRAIFGGMDPNHRFWILKTHKKIRNMTVAMQRRLDRNKSAHEKLSSALEDLKEETELTERLKERLRKAKEKSEFLNQNRKPSKRPNEDDPIDLSLPTKRRLLPCQCQHCLFL